MTGRVMLITCLLLAICAAGTARSQNLSELQVVWTQNRDTANIIPHSSTGWRGDKPPGTIFYGDTIWLGVRNQLDDQRKKFFAIKIYNPRLSAFTITAEGFFSLVTNNPVKVTPLVNRRGDPLHAWEFEPQPAWERITLRADSSIFPTFPPGPDPMTWSFEANSMCADTLTVEQAFKLGQGSVGAPGAMVGHPRTKEVWVFPRRVRIVFGPGPIPYPILIPEDWAEETYTPSPVDTDPEGVFHPYGGVKFVTVGPGLTENMRFSMEVPLSGPTGEPFDIFTYDADAGHYDHFVVRGNAPMPAGNMQRWVALGLGLAAFGGLIIGRRRTAREAAPPQI